MEKKTQKVIDKLIDVGYSVADNIPDKEKATDFKAQMKEIKQKYHSDYKEDTCAVGYFDDVQYSDEELDNRMEFIRKRTMEIIAEDKYLTEKSDKMGFIESTKYFCSKEYENDKRRISELYSEFDKLLEESKKLFNIRQQRRITNEGDE